MTQGPSIANRAAVAVGSMWRAGAVALAVALVCLVGPAGAPAAQGPAVGCGYGTGGPFASNLCWITVRALPGVAGVKVNRASTGGAGQVKAAHAERAVRIRPSAARGGGVTG
jgi:hypothetical protein